MTDHIPISSIFVDTGRSKSAFERFEFLRRYGREENFCRALVLCGPSRSGKTQMVHQYIRNALGECGAGRSVARIVYVRTLKGCTPRTFCENMLVALKDPDPDGGSLADKIRRITEAIRRYGVEMLALDDVHWLVDLETNRINSDVAMLIASLLNECVCPILVIGEMAVQRIFEGRAYAEGRTMGEFVVTPFDWRDERDRLEFRAFLHQIDNHLDLPGKSNLAAPNVALRIHSFSGGLLGQAARLVGDARMLAHHRSLPSISHELLAETVDRLRIGAAKNLLNPFRIDAIEPAPPAALYPPVAEKKPRKKK